MSLGEIAVPDTHPATEWVAGRALQKMSATYTHAMLQKQWLFDLDEWSEAGLRGRVGAEWGFRIAPPGEPRRPLVPDVAFISFEALPRGASGSDLQMPLAPPTIVVEIRSFADRDADLADKVSTYMRAGSSLVIVTDPRDEVLWVHDAQGTHVFVPGDRFEHALLPGFSLDVADLFDRSRY